MRVVAAVVLGLAATSAAQPVTHPCEVTVALAPDDVRAEIEAWVAAEPRCVRDLEVRVVPTGDALYLEARDATGRVRDRIVPDAQSAAVLVVSWMADDTLGRSMPPAESRAPGMRAERDDELPAGLSNGRTRGGRLALTVGALGNDDSAGARLQLDLITRGGWRFGLAGGAMQKVDHGDGSTGQVRAVLGVERRVRGALSMRAQISVGANVTTGDDDRMRHDAPMELSRRPERRAVPAADAALLGVLRINGTWSLVGGPVVEATPDGVTPGGFLGVERGL